MKRFLLKCTLLLMCASCLMGLYSNDFHSPWKNRDEIRYYPLSVYNNHLIPESTYAYDGGDATHWWRKWYVAWIAAQRIDTDTIWADVYLNFPVFADSFTFYVIKDTSILTNSVSQKHYFDNWQEAIDSASTISSDTAWATVIVEGGYWDDAAVRCSSYILLEGRGAFLSAATLYMHPQSTVMNMKMGESSDIFIMDSVSVINCEGGGIDVYGDYCYISGCELTDILTIYDGYDNTYIEGVRSNERLRVNSDYNTIIGCEFRSYDATAPVDPSYLSSTADYNRLIGNVFKGSSDNHGLKVVGQHNIIMGNWIASVLMVAGGYRNHFLNNHWVDTSLVYPYWSTWSRVSAGPIYFWGSSHLKLEAILADSVLSLSVKDNTDFSLRGGIIAKDITVERSEITFGHFKAYTLSIVNCELVNDLRLWSPSFNIENLTFSPGHVVDIYILGESAGEFNSTHFRGKVVIRDSVIMTVAGGGWGENINVNPVNLTFRNCIFDDSVTHDVLYRTPEIDTLTFINCQFASDGLVKDTGTVTYTGFTRNNIAIGDTLYRGTIDPDSQLMTKKYIDDSISQSGLYLRKTVPDTAQYDIWFDKDIYLPATTDTSGVLYIGGDIFLHRYGGITNAFLGRDAGNLTLSGTNNVGIGLNVMTYLTSGTQNVGIGAGALQALTTASFNTAVGYNALLNDTSTGYNTALGFQVLYSNTSGRENTGFGDEALYRNTTGSYNTGFGSYSNYYNQAGSLNVMIGYEAGKGGGVHSKSGGVFIGYMAGFNDTTDNKLYINNDSSSTPLIYGDFDTNYVRIHGYLIVDSLYTGLATFSGKIVAGSFGTPTDVTATRKYGAELHYSGNNYDVTGLRARASLKTTDASTRTAQGAVLQGANADGIDAAVVQGALIEGIGKSSTTGARTGTLRGVLANTEWSAKDTITDLRTAHIRTHTRDATGDGCFDGSGYLVYLENEAVGGNGQALDAGIYFKGTNLSGGNNAFTTGIDFSGATFTTAELKLKNGGLISNPHADTITITEANVKVSANLHATTLFGDGSNLTGISDWDEDSAWAFGYTNKDSNNVFTGKQMFQDTLKIMDMQNVDADTGLYVYCVIGAPAFGAGYGGMYFKPNISGFTSMNYYFYGDDYTTDSEVYAGRFKGKYHQSGNGATMELVNDMLFYPVAGYDILNDVDASGEEWKAGDVNTEGEYVTIDQYGVMTVPSLVAGIDTFGGLALCDTVLVSGAGITDKVVANPRGTVAYGSSISINIATDTLFFYRAAADTSGSDIFNWWRIK